MKTPFKLLVFVLFCSFTFSSLQAQTSIGAKIGFNIATDYGEDIAELEGIGWVIGRQIGGVVEIRINEKLAIQPELLYFQKGSSATTEIDSTGRTFTSKTFLNYLEIPILLKLLFGGSAESTQFFATVGPSIGLALDGRRVLSGGSSDKFGISEEEITRLDFSLAVGGGAKFPVGKGKIFVDTRLLLGLNTTDASRFETEDKNIGIGIAFGYLFKIGEQ